VGGTSDLVSDRFAVVWEEADTFVPIPPIKRYLKLASVDQNNVVDVRPDLYSEGFFSPPLSLTPSISSIAGQHRHWVVSFSPEYLSSFDIRMRGIAAVDFAPSNELLRVTAESIQPETSVAGNGRDFLVAYTDAGTNRTTMGFPLSLLGGLNA
jgi:hypothetical protein